MTIEGWRGEIARMDHELNLATGRMKASAPDSELHVIRQSAADKINWRLLAFQLAEPHIEALYMEHGAAKASEKNYSARSRYDTERWTKSAGTTGVLGLLVLLIAGGFDLSGWITALGVFLLIAMAFCAVSAFLAHGDWPDTTVSMNLNSKIHQVETACKQCQDVDDYNAVKQLLARLSRPVAPVPPVSSDLVARSN